MKIIGFANKYYTLWEVDKYVEAEHYRYIQNLSFDKNEAIRKAGTSEIDTSLNSNKSFIKYLPYIYLDEGYDTVVKFGKYDGYSLKNILKEDKEYLIWLAQNCWNESLSKIVNNLPDIKEHLEEIKKQKEWENQSGSYIGNIGDKIEVKAKVLGCPSFEGYYGTSYINLLQDEKGNHFVWKSGNSLDRFEGEVIVIKGTLKEHKEYKGKNQNILTRCKVLEK